MNSTRLDYRAVLLPLIGVFIIAEFFSALTLFAADRPGENCRAYLSLAKRHLVLRQGRDRTCGLVCAINASQILKSRLGETPLADPSAKRDELIGELRLKGVNVLSKGLDDAQLHDVIQMLFPGHSIQVRTQNIELEKPDKISEEDLEVSNDKAEIKLLRIFIDPAAPASRHSYHALLLLDYHPRPNKMPLITVADPDSAISKTFQGELSLGKLQSWTQSRRVMFGNEFFPTPAAFTVVSVTTITVTGL